MATLPLSTASNIQPMSTASSIFDMGALNEKQTAALEGMRKNFPSELPSYGLPLDDSTFCRYLKARSLDLTKAIAMLNATIKWRNEFGLVNMSEWGPILEKENCTGKMYVRGVTKEGQVILYMKPKHENTREHDGNMKHLVYTMERVVAVAVDGKHQDKMVLLIDYDGFSMSMSPHWKTSMESLHVMQNHYPERLHCAYLIRPPWAFNVFWTAISPFVDPNTKKKIVMNAVTATIAEKIDINVLETSLGGEDDRPFDSKKYLTGPFGKDFTALLDDL